MFGMHIHDPANHGPVSMHVSLHKNNSFKALKRDDSYIFLLWDALRVGGKKGGEWGVNEDTSDPRTTGNTLCYSLIISQVSQGNMGPWDQLVFEDILHSNF